MARTLTKKSRKGKYPKKKRSVIKPGITRQVGFYGRYNGTPGWERKWFDTDIASQVIPAGGHIIATMNLVQQNTGANGRIGRKIHLTSLHMDNFYVLGPTSVNGATYRITVFLDKQCNGAAAQFGDLWANPGDMTSFPNLANTGRFVFLYDKTFILNPTIIARSSDAMATTVTDRVPELSYHGKWSKRVSIPIEFSDVAGAATIADIRSNNIGICLQCGTAGANDSTINGNFRIRYSDS